MLFGTKSYLKNNRYHTPKHPSSLGQDIIINASSKHSCGHRYSAGICTAGGRDSCGRVLGIGIRLIVHESLGEHKHYKLFTETLETKGLVHYQYNNDPKNLAVAVSAFGSASAGTVSIPSTLFTTGVDSGILAEAFKTDVATIEKIRAGFA